MTDLTSRCTRRLADGGRKCADCDLNRNKNRATEGMLCGNVEEGIQHISNHGSCSKRMSSNRDDDCSNDART